MNDLKVPSSTVVVINWTTFASLDYSFDSFNGISHPENVIGMDNVGKYELNGISRKSS
jgi:hypothetical protein